MNHTSNYQLSQWESTDRILMSDFNSDNAKLDAVLKANADAISEETAAREAAVAGKGNCQIYFDTYTGDGLSGEGHARTLTFPHRPLMVLVTEAFDSASMMAVYGTPTIYSRATGAAWNEAAWGDKTFTWWSDNASAQMNENGKTYNVVALVSVED